MRIGYSAVLKHNMNHAPDPTLADLASIDDPELQKWLRAHAAERRRVIEDLEGLHVREENLRAYEQRLRALQSETKQTRSMWPDRAESALWAAGSRSSRASDNPAQQDAWDKLHRAEEILAAEQAHLRNERLALGEEQRTFQQRKEAITVREEQLAAREAAIAVLESAAAPRATQTQHTRVENFAPTAVALARSVLRGIKTT
jgi:hypothetical protein